MQSFCKEIRCHLFIQFYIFSFFFLLHCILISWRCTLCFGNVFVVKLPFLKGKKTLEGSESFFYWVCYQLSTAFPVLGFHGDQRYGVWTLVGADSYKHYAICQRDMRDVTLWFHVMCFGDAHYINPTVWNDKVEYTLTNSL